MASYAAIVDGKDLPIYTNTSWDLLLIRGSLKLMRKRKTMTRILRCLTAKMAVGALLNRCLAERMGFGKQLLLERPFGQRHIIGLVLLFFHGLAKCCKRTICFFQSFIVLGVEQANFGSIAAPKSLRTLQEVRFLSDISCLRARRLS